MLTLWGGIVRFFRESILMLYPIGATLLFSFLYIFSCIQRLFCTGESRVNSNHSSGEYGTALEVVPKIRIDKIFSDRIGAFWYDKQVDGLYHESPWWFPVQIGVTHGLTKCQVTPMFLQLPFILKGWINHDILLREIELLRLAQSGKILMHASCVNNTLIVGFPNAGKTYQTYKSVSEGGMLISEEYTIISGKTATPYKPIMRTCFSARTLKDCKLETSLFEKVWLCFATLRAWIFPFMYEAVIWKNIPVVGKSSEIKKIIYGSTGREIKDWKTFAILAENEFPFMSSEFLQAYAVASGFDILGIQEKQRNLIKEFVNAVYPVA